MIKDTHPKDNDNDNDNARTTMMSVMKGTHLKNSSKLLQSELALELSSSL